MGAAVRPEALLAIYTILKGCFLGYCAYAVYGWPLFLTLPGGLFLSFVPIVSEGIAIYLGEQAFATGYAVMAGIVLMPLLPFAGWMGWLWFCDARGKKDAADDRV